MGAYFSDLLCGEQQKINQHKTWRRQQKTWNTENIAWKDQSKGGFWWSTFCLNKLKFFKVKKYTVWFYSVFLSIYNPST